MYGGAISSRQGTIDSLLKKCRDIIQRNHTTIGNLESLIKSLNATVETMVPVTLVCKIIAYVEDRMRADISEKCDPIPL